ncbi:MAG: hypothetical protein ACRYG5_01320 [Janthinobacterium lividum]
MFVVQPVYYKGFELHPLVFTRRFERFDGHKKHAEGYDAAVRVCRPGALSGADDSRVFKLVREMTFTELGNARRSVTQYGQDIIDGKIDGASVADL